MKSKSLILMAVSLGFGLVAAVGISQVMGRNNGGGGQKTNLVSVIVATEYLDHETELNENNCREERWPAEIVPENSAHTMEDVKSKAVTTRIPKGYPISLADLIDLSKIQPLAIPPGYRVQGVKVSSEDVSSGLIKPGDRVDLIGAFDSQNTGGEKSTTIKTFMKNVKVFHINGNTQRETGPRKPTGGGGDCILGLLVTLKQAEQIFLVERVAKLRVTLRDGTSEDESQNASLTSDEDPDTASFLEQISSFINQQSAKPDPQPVATQEKPAGPAFVQMIYQGGELLRIPFDAEGNIIIPEEKPESAMQAASLAYQKQLAEQEQKSHSEDNGDNNSDDSSDNENDAEEDQYPKQ